MHSKLYIVTQYFPLLSKQVIDKDSCQAKRLLKHKPLTPMKSTSGGRLIQSDIAYVIANAWFVKIIIFTNL
jgi:hypothetical protein